MSRKALDLLTAYAWPGNVRELKNEVDRAVLLARDGGHLESEHFAPVRYAVEQVTPSAPPAEFFLPGEPTSGALHDRVEALECEAILEALRAAQRNKAKAVQILGIARNGLALKMQRLGLSSH